MGCFCGGHAPDTDTDTEAEAKRRPDADEEKLRHMHQTSQLPLEEKRGHEGF